ncbi:Enoyl-[acyl-carrier-protein] reductase [NADH] [Cribrihabitans marinus]|uniref:Enoyl-[acyl-carrier-protein] reductase [NADH] n=1 Tax=Cribrihabitans marinus TaxID=1227549 RepID=A0A1H6QBI9_9RHOB|nr:enoyl-ACP reductase FabI [Cribrihabitans marinus]GGH18458.1 enoyl-[acyl-carrier-protein] reductase [NADH] [Cribrihabitans marinus]SEI41113.1 Enoyl-[acyl-carrier-protein] reductase [NADH] [Cribrihabitans marinus]
MPDFRECCDPAELLDLSGRKGLVVGIANDRSLAWPAALHFRQAGAELAITYVGERTKPHVAPLAARLDAPILLPCNVAAPHELAAVFEAITERWGKLDFILHAVGSVPPADLHGRLTDCSAEGFTEAMDVSVHSLVRMARLAEPLMTSGGSLITLSYLGGERVVENYNVMGPVKAALEATVRYLAHELGPASIRVNAISAGPVRTRAASGLTGFTGLLGATARAAPLRRNIEADEVGRAALLFASDYTSGITGEVLHVDAGVHIESPVLAAETNDKPEES